VFLPASSIASLSRDMDTDKAPANGPEDRQPRVKSETSNASEMGLTPREFETLVWLVRGLPSKAIALRMGLEDITVRKYISHLLAHFNLRRRTELIVMLADRGIKLGVPPVTDPALDRSLPAAGGTQPTDFSQRVFDRSHSIHKCISDVTCARPHPEQLRKGYRRHASIRHVTGIGRRQWIHLSPTIAVYRLRMCVATAFRLTKNEYDSNAEGAFVECTRSGESS
jgi:DNA-binding CsgD family transcriptional regulator